MADLAAFDWTPINSMIACIKTQFKLKKKIRN
jgi:hypothetical protein